jgi:pimeloyl-ACP methyl ester carboxylesterase
MLEKFAFISLLIVVAVSSGFAGQNETEINIEGIWKGPLKIGQSEQRLIVYLSMDSDGTMKAIIDSPDEGVKGITVEGVKYENDVLILEIEETKNYKGKLSEDGTRIEGKLTTSRMQIPLTLERTGEAYPSTRPQDPQKPYPYITEDAIAGITYLRSRAKIDHDLIGLVGHSEGSVVATMVAARLQSIAYVVMLSGMGISGDMTLIRQTEAIAKASGIDKEIIGVNISLQEKIYAVLKNNSNHQTLRKKLRNICLSQVSALGQGINEEMELQIQEHISQVTSPWFLYFVNYDPQSDLAEAKCPLLILFGEKDLQTPPQFHVPAIKQALRSNGHSQSTVKIMPGLNHLFQGAETGLISEYNKISETISPSVLQLIGEWILGTSRRAYN